MVGVLADGDKVVIELYGRRRDLLLDVGRADDFSRALLLHASVADGQPVELVRGEVWGASVESFDGMVAVRFHPPDAGAPTRVPLTAAAARSLAGMVRAKATEAEYKLRIVWKGK